MTIATIGTIALRFANDSRLWYLGDMRSLGADTALVAVPSLIGAAAAALAGHTLLAAFADLQGGGWFTLSMLFLPLYGILGIAFSAWCFHFTEGRLEYGKLSIRSGRANLATVGGIAAVIGLAYQPSVFVAIAASTAGAAYFLTLHHSGKLDRDRTAIPASERTS